MGTGVFWGRGVKVGEAGTNTEDVGVAGATIGDGRENAPPGVGVTVGGIWTPEPMGIGVHSGEAGGCSTGARRESNVHPTTSRGKSKIHRKHFQTRIIHPSCK